MKIERINIVGFRSIQEFELECGSSMNVIAGVNGAGKSSILAAIEIGLSWAKARMRLKVSNGISPDVNDINKHLKHLSIRISASEEDTNLKWTINSYSPSYSGIIQKSDFQELNQL